MLKVRQLLIVVAMSVLCCLFNSCDKEEKLGSIYGVVTDFSTDEPVKGANVQLRPSGETTLTGSDGMYEILEVPNGDYSITVSKAGYTDLVDDYVIVVKDGKKMRRDVQIKPLPASLHIYDNNSQEISELDFGADAGVTKKTFQIFNEGTQKINYTIEKSVDWITNINHPEGTIDAGKGESIVVTINRRLLSVGDNTTTMLITSNVGGGKELTVKARNEGAQPIVNIFEAISIDSTTYRVKCEVVSDGGSTVTERGICWNTYGDPTMEDEKIQFASGGTGEYTIRMEHLTMATHYYVKAYAKNEFGVGLSEVLDFVTGAIVTPPAVKTVEVHDVTATSAVCKGNVTDDGGADLIERGVCWGTSANPTTSGHHQAASQATTGEFSVSITGLETKTTYHVRAYAKNSRGTSYGNDLTFTTGADKPTVTTATVTDVTSTTAKAGGEITDDGGSAVTERGVCWSTSHNPTTSGSHATSGTDSNAFTVNITGLTPSTTYYVKAYAKNSVGTSYGNEVSFVTGAPPVYTVSVSAEPSEGGTVTGGGSYQHGKTCTVKATPATGYTFVKWTKDGEQVSTTANYSFKVEEECSLVAHFQKASYTVTVSANPSNCGTVTGGGTYEYGESCTVTASANDGYEFVKWTENGNQVSPDESYTFTVSGNRTLVAQFQIKTYTITTSSNPTEGGTTSGGGSYQNGQQCTLRAVAATGYEFVNWTKDGAEVSANAVYTFTVTETASYVAQFQAKSYTITVDASPVEGGSVRGGGTYYYGQTCTVVATAVGEYRFVSWTENGQDVSTNESYGFTVTGDRALVAHFTNAPIGAIDGLFTVNESGGQVYFSQGNLQFIGGTRTWKFADKQWDVVGNSQANEAQGSTRDLFGWGASGYNHGANCYQPWSTSTQGYDYCAYGDPNKNLYDETGMADWGYNAISNGGNQENSGWRTLTNEEWVYVVDNRPTASGVRYAKGTVNHSVGIILLPDNWDPSTFHLNNTNNSTANYSGNVITESQWAVLENVGAIFLPSTGYLYGNTYNGTKGFYWSSSNGNGMDAMFLGFDLNYNSGGYHTFVPNYCGGKEYRKSVRLVRNAQ